MFNHAMRIPPYFLRSSCVSKVSIVLLVVASCCGATAVCSEPIPFQMPAKGVCGHRGASDTHPENTLAAFRKAILLGAQMIEFDVAITKDGSLVLMHDATVDRTTNGKGRISELTFDEIQKLDAGSWKSKNFKDERVPTLRQALDIMPENIWLNVHLKGDAQLAAKATEEIIAADRVHQCFLACGKEAAIAAKAISNDIKICNMERQSNTQQYVDETIAGKADFIQLHGGASVDPALTKQLKDAEIRTNFCCTNEVEPAKALFQAGVEFVLADKLEDILAVSDDLGIERLTPVYRERTQPSKVPATAVFTDGEAQIVPEFSDANLWINHDLWVETEFDTDGDGKPDRMHVSVTRPRQTDTEHLKVPIIYESSPYFSGTASGRNFFWNPQQELGATPPEHEAPTSVPFVRRRVVISRTHLNDWVPRGFAVVHSASPGTGLSQGCPTIGGDNESLAPKAVIDWLCGRAAGYTTPDGDHRVTAYWSSGNVGMTGTSYNGTIPLAAATTGVDGLKAIIPVAPNTSYYHYYRSNGLVRHPGGYIGEDVDVLYNFINSGDPSKREYCDCNVRDKEMAAGRHRESGDYNEFWAGRDYLNDMGPMKAALLMAHAFNDWNVMPEHSVRIYKAAQAKGLPVQSFFHQGGHGGPPPLKMMNRWFTRYVCGIENGVENDPKAWIVRENEDRQKPTAYADYPNPKSESVVLKPAKQETGPGSLLPVADAGQGTAKIIDDYTVDGTTLAKAEESKHRLMFVTPTLTKPVHLSGLTRFKTKLACSKPAANFSVWLVSLPWSTDPKTQIYDNIITRGWADPQNRHSLTESSPLEPGTFYSLEFDLQPDDHIVPAGQQIGLMIFCSDKDFTLWPEPGTELTIDLDATSIDLPVVGGISSYENAFRPADNAATEN